MKQKIKQIVEKAIQKIDRKTAERGLYMIVVIALVIYGTKNTDTAVKLMKSLTEAFTLILTT